MADNRFHGQAMAENRLYPRKKMKLLVHYHCVNEHDTCVVETTSQDISYGGLALFGERKMHIGQLLMVTIFIPPEEKRLPKFDYESFTDESCIPINALVRVAWCRNTEEKLVTLGLQFLHLIVEDRQKMDDFAKEFELVNSQQRSAN